MLVCSVAKVLVGGTDRLHYQMITRTQSATAKRHNERVLMWNNLVRNLAIHNAGRKILLDLEHELRALDQVRFTTDE